MDKNEFLCIDDVFAYERCKEQCDQCKEVVRHEPQDLGFRRELDNETNED